jgi:hypothetical protein
VAEREVRFTEQFFSRLEWLLPEERQADGTPSITDFILHELPRVRDRLASDFDLSTLPTEEPGVRVFVGAGSVVPRFAIYVALQNDDVEAYWLVIDGIGEDEDDSAPE